MPTYPFTEHNILSSIQRFLQRQPPYQHIAIPVGDDAAVVHIPQGQQVVLSCDTLTENRDFRRRYFKPQDVGHKAIESALADLAAMGATPWCILASISVPNNISQKALLNILQTIAQRAHHHQAPLVGGDLSSTDGPLQLTITVVGCLHEPAFRRYQGQPGDVVFVTEVLGKAAMGLYALEEDKPAPELWYTAQKRPSAPIATSLWLKQHACIRSCVDISDGLAAAARLLPATPYGMTLIQKQLPYCQRSISWKLPKPRWWYALYGGEDYALAACLPAENWLSMCREALKAGFSLYKVGYITENKQFLLKTPHAEEPLEQGFSHF
jgi:thiamine-monophosphate kinase